MLAGPERECDPQGIAALVVFPGSDAATANSINNIVSGQGLARQYPADEG